jgi:hypothetical protein
VTDANGLWQHMLADWAIPADLVATAPVSPYFFDDRGGHFPAMEVPDLLTADIRAFFRRHR